MKKKSTTKWKWKWMNKNVYIRTFSVKEEKTVKPFITIKQTNMMKKKKKQSSVWWIKI